MKLFQKGDLVEMTMLGSDYHKKRGLVVNRRHALSKVNKKAPDWLENPEDWGMDQCRPDEYYCKILFSDPPFPSAENHLIEVRAKWLRLLSGAEKS